MRLELNVKNLSLPSDLREAIERRIRLALGRFVGRIAQVTVGLADTNGPRRGIDKQCRMVVQLIPAGTVTIEERHSDLAAAVALAAERAAWNVGRELKRRRDARHAPRSRTTPSDGWERVDAPHGERATRRTARHARAAEDLPGGENNGVGN